jgi:hypothetical protein
MMRDRLVFKYTQGKLRFNIKVYSVLLLLLSFWRFSD